MKEFGTNIVFYDSYFEHLYFGVYRDKLYIYDHGSVQVLEKNDYKIRENDDNTNLVKYLNIIPTNVFYDLYSKDVGLMPARFIEQIYLDSSYADIIDNL